MNLQNKARGDSDSFNKNWVQREETLYNHWTEGEPQNQIQLAFRSHWELFKELMGDKIKGGKSLEVGCGRASISSYFAQNGFDVSCLDLSAHVIDTAKKIYAKNGQKGEFIVGDALDLPFPEKSFDVTVSIGLLEHFEDFDKVVSEQVRVLKPGGLFLGYVVPENPTNVQKDFNWVNDIIKSYAGLNQQTVVPKEEIYRSDTGSTAYLESMKTHGLQNAQASGVYPLPMISPSISFPFTLMPPEMENTLVNHYKTVLADRKKQYNQNPWLCEESYGQAFLVWGWKK